MMCSDALEFDKATLKNASRDSARLIEAYGRAFYEAQHKFERGDLTLKLHEYWEVPAEFDIYRRYMFNVYVRNESIYLGELLIQL